jgi:hypothetical protein
VAYQLDPTPLRPRSGTRTLVSALAVVIAVGVVVVALARDERTDSRVASAASAAARPSVGATGLVPDDPGASGSGGGSSNPQLQIYCHAVEARRCGDIASVALTAVADPGLPPPLTIDVWGSLLCGSVFDCPPDRLAGRRPAGSAVIAFRPATDVWVNVTDTAADAPGHLAAWVIRSSPSG